MHLKTLSLFQHHHHFGAISHEGERRTRWVVAVTLAMMVAEIAAGALTHSMALLADGWHMGTHAGALGIALFAYWYARRHAGDRRYTFGTGKVSVLGGFASAVVLFVVALLVAVESAQRFWSPLTIRFDEALLVAFVGLAVNLLCAWVLMGASRGHPENGHVHAEHSHPHGEHHGQDHNIRAAYLHVLADALTSVTAIVALGAGRELGWVWMDPVMGIVGALVIVRWSLGLLRETARILLDGDISPAVADAIRGAIEADADNRVADLHVWRVGSHEQAAILSIVTLHPRPPSHYRALLARFPDLEHVSIEIQACEVPPAAPK